MGPRIGRALRDARNHAGLRLIDVAGPAGVSQAVLSRFERGHGWPRDPDRVVGAYAAACGVSPLELWRAALELED